MKAARHLLLIATVLASSLAAGTKTPSGYQVYPTRNDIATSTGDGRNFREETMAPALSNFYQQNFTAKGLTAGAASTTLSLTFTPGVCYINGFYVNITTATEVDMTGSTVNCTYIELPTTSGLVNAVRFNNNTTCSPPSTNSYLVASSTASSSSVTASVNAMPSNSYLAPYSNAISLTIATAAGVWFPPVGVTSIFVEMVGPGGGGGGAGGTWSIGREGGAGGYLNAYILGIKPGVLIKYVIGTGGAGGAAGATAGSNGSSTTWFYDSTHFFANFGVGNAGAAPTPTDGAASTYAPYSMTIPSFGWSLSGNVCSSVWSSCTENLTHDSHGVAGIYGSGGSGGNNFTGCGVGCYQAGGKGGDGVIVIHY